MKNKIFGLLSLSIIFLLAVTLVSAVSFQSKVLPRSLGEHSVDIAITSNINQTISFEIQNVPTGIKVNSISNSSFTEGVEKSITISYNVTDDFETDFEDDYSLVLVAKEENGTKTNSEYLFEKSYCKFGEVGKIYIDVDDEELDNEDAWKWKIFNKIELTINVENKATEDMSGTIEYCLYDEDEKECVISDDFDFDVAEKEDDDFTVNFQLSPSDLNLDSSSYTLYIKAYDEDEWDESEQCAEFSRDITLKVDSNAVMIDEDGIDMPEEISAGDTITLEVPVYNVGSKNQDDISVKLYSKTLGVSTIEQSVGDLDSGDDKTIYFTFQVPETAVEGKNYEVILEVYDEDGEIYELKDNGGDKYDAVFNAYVKIANGASSSTSLSSASVAAKLDGEAIAGKEMVVKASIQNTGSKTAVFSLNALSYGAFADDVTINPSTVQLVAGESKQVTLTFDVKDTASGKNKFTLEVLSGDELVTSQSISVEIEGKKSLFSSISFGSNWYLWAIGIFNVLLVLVIIFVAVRLVRK